MKRNDILFAVGVVAVVAVLYVLSVSGKKPPDIPPDMDHVAAKTKEDCKACHDKDKISPLPQGHPFKDQCPECHRLKASGHGVMR
jgi:hypothetical protein